MGVSRTSNGLNVNLASNPVPVCERARLRARAHMKDPSIKLTKLEQAFLEAFQR